MKNIFLLSLTLLSINAANADIYYSPNELGKLNEANLQKAKKICYTLAFRIGSMQTRLSQVEKLEQTKESRKAIEDATNWLKSEEVKKIKSYCGADE